MCIIYGGLGLRSQAGRPLAHSWTDVRAWKSPRKGPCPEPPPRPGSSALLLGKLSIWGWRRDQWLTLLWAPVSWGRRVKGAGGLVLLSVVALKA